MITSCSNPVEKQLDLSKATILISPAIKSPVNETAKGILLEEINKRTALELDLSEKWGNKTIIALALTSDKDLYGEGLPDQGTIDLPELEKEGFWIFHENKNEKDILWIIGADARGVLYGIGKLLRMADMQDHQIKIDNKIDEISKLRSKVQKANVQHQLEVRKLLTPEQQKIFDSRTLRGQGRRAHGKGFYGRMPGNMGMNGRCF